MTSSLLAFQMTVYEPRSDQSNPTTEPDILSPAAGAPHSEAFKVATIQGLSGFKPLMGIPTGKRGRFDPLTCRCETGQLRVPIYDFRIVEGGSQANRWGSAQLGGADGRPIPIGCKVIVKRSKDGGATFADYWTGRVQSIETEGAQILALNLVDMAPTLNYKMGSFRPHASASGIVMPSQLPLGLTAPLGVIGAYRDKGPLSGTVKSTSSGVRYIELDSGSRSRPDNILTAQLKAKAKRELYTKGITLDGSGLFNDGLRLHFISGVVNKEASPTSFELKGVPGTSWVSITKIFFESLLSTDPFYTAISTGTIPNNTVVTFDVRRIEEPVYWVVATASQFLQDIAAGYHGDTDASGTVKRRVSVNATAVAALPSLPTDRWPVTPGKKAQDWLEGAVCLPRKLGYRFNESGELVPFSTAIPTSIGSLVTITDTDLVAGTTPSLSVSQQGAKTGVRVNGFLDIPLKISDLPEREQYPVAPDGLVSFGDGDENELDYFVHLPRDQDLDESVITIDAQGFRAMKGETIYNMDRAVWLREQQQDLVDHFQKLFGQSPIKIKGKYRDTSNLSTVYQGTWCLVNHTRIPNLGNHVRGGAVLALCTDRSEDGLTLDMEYLVAGQGTLANSPTLGAPAQEAGNTKYGITCAVTLNGQSDPVTVWVNATATSVGVRPADSDPGWRMAYPLSKAGKNDFQITATGTETFRINASGMRYWLRARSEGALAAKLNSAWVYPGSGTGYIDTAAMTSVTSLTVSSVTAKSCHLVIVPGDASAPIALLIGSGANQAAADATTPTRVLTLPAGTTVFDLTGLDDATKYAGAWFKLQVAHLDAWGNVGPVTGTGASSFQATGTATGAPVGIAPLVIRKSTTVAPQQLTPAGGVTEIADYGIEFQIPAGPSGMGFDVEIRKGTVSGALTLYDKLYAEQTQGRAVTYRDIQAPDDVTYYYDYRFTHPGYVAGSYSAEVSAKAGLLPPNLPGSDVGEPVLGQLLELVLTAGDFHPSLNTDAYLRSATSLITNGNGYSFFAVASARLPAGTVIDSIEMRGAGMGAGNSLQLSFYEVDEAAATVTIGSATIGNTGALTTVSDTGLDFPVVAHRRYVFECQLTAGAGGSAILDRVSVFCRPNSYTQVR